MLDFDSCNEYEAEDYEYDEELYEIVETLTKMIDME